MCVGYCVNNECSEEHYGEKNECGFDALVPSLFGDAKVSGCDSVFFVFATDEEEWENNEEEGFYERVGVIAQNGGLKEGPIEDNNEDHREGDNANGGE